MHLLFDYQSQFQDLSQRYTDKNNKQTKKKKIMQKSVNCTTVWNLKRPKTYQMTIIRDLIELTKVYSHSEVLANCKKEWSISLYPSMETSVEYMIKQKKSKVKKIMYSLWAFL